MSDSYTQPSPEKDRLRSIHTFDLSAFYPDSFSRILGWTFVLIALLSMVGFSWGAWDYFIRICPNTDVLTWDENIRLNIVYDQYSDFKNGDILSGVKPFFEAPTWPPLRSFITFSLLFFPDSLLVTEWDSLVGLLFLMGTFVSFVWISYNITKDFLITGIISLSGFPMLFQTIEVSAYSLSSMLETQSMFFLLWCYYFFYRFYGEGEDLHRRTVVGVSAFLLLFFFTKYPYGLMLFIAVFVIEFARNHKKIIEGIRFAFIEHYRGIRIFILSIALLMILSIPFLRLIEGVDFNQRAFKLSLYYISLPVFLDLQYFLWKNRVTMGSILPKSLRIIYLYSFLPAMIWIYGNPDRVSSLLDAQMIVNDHTKSFFLSIVASRSEDPMLPMAVFDDPWGIRILLLMALSSGLYILFHSRKKLADFLEHPLFLVTVLLFLQILILETTTGNKQQRHILQYLPALALILWLWLIRGLVLFRSKIFEVMVATAFLGSILVLSGSHGLWAGNFFQDRYFCLRGEDKSVFEPVRWVESKLPRDKNLLLFNGFHETFNYDKKGRLIASEFDLKIRESRYENQLIRHDNKHKWKSWTRFDELVLISYSCEDPNLLEKLKMRSEAVSASLKPVSRQVHPSGEYCVERFRIE